MARAKLKEPRVGTCVGCGKTFTQAYYQENTCSTECWHENRRQRWEHLRLTNGCARCHVIKPLNEYTGHTTPHCKACFNSDRRERFTSDDYRRQCLKKHNLTQQQFDDLLLAQGGRCAVCRTGEPGGRHDQWNVDHDHAHCPGIRSCGRCIRGLLCNSCNNMLGRAHDDAGVLRSGADYLDRWAMAR